MEHMSGEVCDNGVDVSHILRGMTGRTRHLDGRLPACDVRAGTWGWDEAENLVFDGEDRQVLESGYKVASCS